MEVVTRDQILHVLGTLPVGVWSFTTWKHLKRVLTSRCQHDHALLCEKCRQQTFFFGYVIVLALANITCSQLTVNRQADKRLLIVRMICAKCAA